MLPRFLALVLITVCTSCNDSADDVIQQKLLTTAVDGWRLTSAFKDGVNDSSFDGLVLEFSLTDYSTNSTGNSVWPSEGQYYFETSLSRVIVRDDGNEFRILKLDDTQLVIDSEFKSCEASNTPSTHYTFSFYRPI